jgi:hypothetical protein
MERTECVRIYLNNENDTENEEICYFTNSVNIYPLDEHPLFDDVVCTVFHQIFTRMNAYGITDLTIAYNHRKPIDITELPILPHVTRLCIHFKELFNFITLCPNATQIGLYLQNKRGFFTQNDMQTLCTSLPNGVNNIHIGKAWLYDVMLFDDTLPEHVTTITYDSKSYGPDNYEQCLDYACTSTSRLMYDTNMYVNPEHKSIHLYLELFCTLKHDIIPFLYVRHRCFDKLVIYKLLRYMHIFPRSQI